MQTSLMQRQSLASTRHARGRAAFTPARPGMSSRSKCVQVLAKKGKGKGVIRQSAGVPGLSGMTGPGAAQQMSIKDAKVPEVDPEQAEFVLFVRGVNVPTSNGKLVVKQTPWIPLSVMKSGQQGKVLVTLLENEWGRKLYSNLLIRQISQSLYKDKEAVASSIRKSYPPLAEVATKNLQYAFKIRDQNDPEGWKNAVDLTELPPETEVQGNPIDTVKAFFSLDNLASLFKTA